jgi:hypothetical protein
VLSGRCMSLALCRHADLGHHGEVLPAPPLNSSLHNAIAPTAAALGGVAAAVFVRSGGSVPLLRCPFHQLTGWWCPGCGLTRGTGRLVTGDIMGAMAHNIFTPLIVLAIAAAWWAWWWPTVSDRLPQRARWTRIATKDKRASRRFTLNSRTTPWAIGILVVFTVARNVPWAPFAVLAP